MLESFGLAIFVVMTDRQTKPIALPLVRARGLIKRNEQLVYSRGVRKVVQFRTALRKPTRNFSALVQSTVLCESWTAFDQHGW